MGSKILTTKLNMTLLIKCNEGDIYLDIKFQRVHGR